MKMLNFERMKKWALCAAVLAFIVLTLAAVLFPDAVIRVFNSREIDRYEIMSRLFMEAAKNTGVCAPEDAAKVWAEGVRMRNGAMQYAVMSDALKTRYAKSLDTAYPNWVTGTSSPWIESYGITETSRSEKERTYTVRFKAATSAGPAGTYDATLTAVKKNSFWQIGRIVQPPGFYAFTGLQP